MQASDNLIEAQDMSYLWFRSERMLLLKYQNTLCFSCAKFDRLTGAARCRTSYSAYSSLGTGVSTTVRNVTMLWDLSWQRVGRSGLMRYVPISFAKNPPYRSLWRCSSPRWLPRLALRPLFWLKNPWFQRITGAEKAVRFRCESVEHATTYFRLKLMWKLRW